MNNGGYMKFSIIIPIYKVEKYLEQCINSVLNQSFVDYELILVDDGSPDLCGKICDDFAKNDNRIKVIHKKNNGLSSARNDGLRISNGDYIVFLDGDDAMCEDSFQKMSSLIEEYSYPDIIIGNIIHWSINNNEIIVDNSKYMSKQGNMNILEINQLYAKDSVQLPWRAYQSIYRKNFLIENNLFFDEDLVGAEDCDYYLKVIQKLKTYTITDTAFVKYRINREGSIINTPSYNSVIGQLKTFANAYNSANIFPDEKLMKTYFANRFTNIIILVNLLNSSYERKICYDFIKTNKFILKFTSNTSKFVFAKAIWKLLGLRKGSNLLLKLKKYF